MIGNPAYPGQTIMSTIPTHMASGPVGKPRSQMKRSSIVSKWTAGAGWSAPPYIRVQEYPETSPFDLEKPVRVRQRFLDPTEGHRLEVREEHLHQYTFDIRLRKLRTVRGRIWFGLEC